MALKIAITIMFIIFTALMYSCIKISGDCSREEEKEDGTAKDRPDAPHIRHM